MKTAQLRQVSVWAALTGLVLVAALLGRTFAGEPWSGALPVLLAAVFGFELILFTRDVMHRVKRRG